MAQRPFSGRRVPQRRAFSDRSACARQSARSPTPHIQHPHRPADAHNTRLQRDAEHGHPNPLAPHANPLDAVTPALTHTNTPATPTCSAVLIMDAAAVPILTFSSSALAVLVYVGGLSPGAPVWAAVTSTCARVKARLTVWVRATSKSECAQRERGHRGQPGWRVQSSTQANGPVLCA